MRCTKCRKAKLRTIQTFSSDDVEYRMKKCPKCHTIHTTQTTILNVNPIRGQGARGLAQELRRRAEREMAARAKADRSRKPNA